MGEFGITRKQVADTCAKEQEGLSIVSVILSLSSASADLSDKQHTKALEYLSLQLALHDRDEISRVLCRSNPDHLTQAVRDGVNAYEPMIRQVPQAVDLSTTVGDFQAFMDDMIKVTKTGTSKKNGGEAKAPSVEDYVKLLHNHMGSCHKFLHQVAKNGKEVTGWFQDYVHKAAADFRQTETSPSVSITKSLAAGFDELKPDEQTAVRDEVDAFASYLDALHTSSAARVRDVINNKSSTAYGPGAYLARWQDLLDSTLITPSKAKGPVRQGADKSIKQEGRRDVDGEIKESGIDTKEADKVIKEQTPSVPSAATTVRLLGPKFRQLVLDAQ